MAHKDANTEAKAQCPKCGTDMRREINGVRVPPMPGVFWFCTNRGCEEGKDNKVYSGG